MATTNLYTRTVGNIELQSGYGKPDHSAPTGSIYSNIPSGSVYINKGDTDWMEFVQSSYGEMYATNLAATLQPAAGNTWEEITGITMVQGTCNGFSVSASQALQLSDNHMGGYYEVKWAVGATNLGTEQFDWGIGINTTAPQDDEYVRATASGTGNDTPYATYTMRRMLNPGDKVSFFQRTDNTSNDYTMNEMWVTVKRISEDDNS